MDVKPVIMNKRLLVIGLDGYETGIAEKLINEGRMPALSRVMANAAQVELDHGAAKTTGLAWEHFSTGLSPQDANRWAAVTFDPCTYKFWQAPTQLTPFPANLPLKTVVFDPPYFDLKNATNVRGLVSWGAHDPGITQFTRPAGLADEMHARFGSYPAHEWIYGHTWASLERTREMGNALAQATKQRAEITEWLLSERCPDWNLGMVVVSELHSAVEALWHGMDESHPLHELPSSEPARQGMEAVYLALDDLIAQLSEAFTDASLLIFAMHGMGPNDSDVASMALLPEFLYRRSFGHAFLHDRNEHAPDTVLNLEADEIWSEYMRGFTPEHRSGGLSRFLARGGRKVRNLKDRMLGGTYTPSLDWMPASWYSPHWKDMQAFALPSFYDGLIRLNVKGREANGSVSPEQYDVVCQEIVRELEQCIDPRTSGQAVRKIVLTHPGEPMSVHETEADIIVLWQDSPLALQTADSDLIGPFPYRRPGGHTGGLGTCLWSGQDFRTGKYGTRSAFDVVPTLIEYLAGDVDSSLSGSSFLQQIVN